MEHQPLGQHRDHRDHHGGAQHGEPVVQAEGRHQEEGCERARHVEGAVREVRHVQDAVDQREAQGHQAVDAPSVSPLSSC
jgi:hypothetical protein